MQFTKLDIPGAYRLDLEKYEDERGFFARTYCEHEFAAHDLAVRMVQTNVSFNKHRGTLRGMHYQAAPHQEAKLVRCTRGAIYDVIVDMRPESSAYQRWIGAELSTTNGRMLYVPEGCAHGLITLTADTEVVYQVSAFYTPSHERGLRYDDPAIGITWPVEVAVISEKDATWPYLEAHSETVDM